MNGTRRESLTWVLEECVAARRVDADGAEEAAVPLAHLQGSLGLLEGSRGEDDAVESSGPGAGEDAV